MLAVLFTFDLISISTFRRSVNVLACVVTVVLVCAIGGESLICDSCACESTTINCTGAGIDDVLDLTDYSDVVLDRTIMYFDYNSFVRVKQLPPSKVKLLSLRHNRIDRIDKLAFTNLQSLMELDLSHNSLTTDCLTSDVFKVNFRLFVSRL